MNRIRIAKELLKIARDISASPMTTRAFVSQCKKLFPMKGFEVLSYSYGYEEGDTRGSVSMFVKKDDIFIYFDYNSHNRYAHTGNCLYRFCENEKDYGGSISNPLYKNNFFNIGSKNDIPKFVENINEFVERRLRIEQSRKEMAE